MQPEKLLQSLSDQEVTGLLEALPKELADRGIELPATLGGATLGATTEVKPVVQPTDVFDALSPEQQEQAIKLTAAMAEKFGVEVNDFSILETKNGIKTVAYTAGNGIDLGDHPIKFFDKKRSWNSIFDKKNSKNFMIKVDGKRVDTRTGMTWDVYDAMINAAKARGDELPDSPCSCLIKTTRTGH